MFVKVYDFADVEMVWVFAVVVGINHLLWDAVFFEGIAVEFVANEGEAGFGKADGAVAFFDRSEVGGSELVAVAAGVAAEVSQVLATVFRKEAHGVVVALF